MKSFQKLYDGIQHGDATGLTARLQHIMASALGAFRKRLPAAEMTSEEFFRVLSPGHFDDVQSFLAEHAERKLPWKSIPKKFVTDDIIAAADKALGQDFTFLGAAHTFTDAMDWHYSLGEGGPFPYAHWSEIPFSGAKPQADIKPCWEMNRHQFFVPMALAATKTGEEKYTRKLVEFINSWCDQNAPEMGVNYISGLEIGLRCIAWIFTDRILQGDAEYDDATRERLHRNLHAQAQHIAEYMSYTEETSRNHHLVGEAVALAYIALCYPEWLNSAKWLKKGLAALWSTLDDQIYPDGMHFEASFGYHLLVTEFTLLLFAEMRRQKKPIPAKAYVLLQSMATALRLARQPDGELPNINDNDNGSVIPLPLTTEERVEGIMAAIAALYERPDYKSAAGENWPLYAHLLLGEDGLEDFRVLAEYPEDVPLLTSQNTSHLYFIRRKKDFVLLKNNPDPAPESGHNHADLLNVILFFDGKPVLVDAGTYKFGDDNGLRNALRSTAAHNTITVDRQGQSEPVRTFNWATVLKSGFTQADEQDGTVIIDAQHDSYERVGVTHRRVLVWFKKEQALAVIDQLQGQGTHEFNQHWHFLPDTAVEASDKNAYRLSQDGKPVAFMKFLRNKEGDLFEITSGSEHDKPCHYSRAYGEVTPGTALRHDWKSTLAANNSSHRITLFTKKETDAAFEDVWHGEFRLFGWNIDLNHTPAKVDKAK